jgi:hypothetical protein
MRRSVWTSAFVGLRRDMAARSPPLFLKQSGWLPGYGIEHENIFRKSECESGLQKGPAFAGVARPSGRHGPELAAARMRRLVEISGGGRTPALFRAKPGQHRLARGGAVGKHTQVGPRMGREVALDPMRAIISNRYARVLRSTAFRM